MAIFGRIASFVMCITLIGASHRDYTLYYLDRLYKSGEFHEEQPRNYAVNLNYQLQCGWEGFSAQLDTINSAPQSSLYLLEENYTMQCRPSRSSKDSSLGSRAMTIDELYDLNANMNIMAFLENGSSFHNFTMVFNNGTWQYPVNRSSLGNAKGSIALPWQVTVYASIKNPTHDDNMYYVERFTIVDNYSDSYLRSSWGNISSGMEMLPRFILADPTSDYRPSVFTRSNPCNPQVKLIIAPDPTRFLRVYIGILYSADAQPGQVRWYSQDLEYFNRSTDDPSMVTQCTISAAQSFVRHVVIKTTFCGTYVSSALFEDFETDAISGEETENEAPRSRVTFKRADDLETYEPTLSGFSVWCSLREVTDKTGRLDKAVGSHDWVSLTQGPAKEWIAVRDPFASSEQNNVTVKLPQLYDNSSIGNFNPNDAYRRRWVGLLQLAAVPEYQSKFSLTYLDSQTGFHYSLYSAVAQGILGIRQGYVFKRRFAELQAGIPYGWPIGMFRYSVGASYEIKRIVMNPVTRDMYMVSDQTIWLVSSDGRATKLLINLKKWNIDFSVMDLSFSKNGVMMYVITGDIFGGVPGPTLRGLSYFGSFAPLTNATSAVWKYTNGILIDNSDAVTDIQLSNAVTSEDLFSRIDDTAVTTSGIDGDPSVFRFCPLPFTSKVFLLLQPVMGSSYYTPAIYEDDRAKTLSVSPVAASTIFSKGTIQSYDPLYLVKAGGVIRYGYLQVRAKTAFLRSADGNYTISIWKDQSNPDFSAVNVTGDDPLKKSKVSVLAEKFDESAGTWLRISFVYTEGVAVMRTPADLIRGGNWTFLPSQWRIADFSADRFVIEDSGACPFVLVTSLVNPDMHLDAGDIFAVEVALMPNTKALFPFASGQLQNQMGNPWRIHVRSELMGNVFVGWRLLYQIEELGSRLHPDLAITPLSFRAEVPAAGCKDDSISQLTIISGCRRELAIIPVRQDPTIPQIILVSVAAQYLHA
ncbi:hypothetical protein RvY_10304 [Ramazzottius varieornatus]|uniref:Uncharacterized protein n=1 Tax=Ramazzottius varieornatus TaxID=947166 RepID=A0A1D1VLC0_RAMVA|nr:hypothetical protein RvY_10304 [Ramazzottius varieornatus]